MEDNKLDPGGPYIQAACFCETVIPDNTGVLSLIRLIDTISQSAHGPNPPEDMPPFNYQLKLVLMLKSGTARGRGTVKIIPEFPNGESKTPIELTVHFEGEEKGVNLVSNLIFTFTLEGLYWFYIQLDGNIITAVPIRVKYDRVVVNA